MVEPCCPGPGQIAIPIPPPPPVPPCPEFVCQTLDVDTDCPATVDFLPVTVNPGEELHLAYHVVGAPVEQPGLSLLGDGIGIFATVIVRRLANSNYVFFNGFNDYLVLSSTTINTAGVTFCLGANTFAIVGDQIVLQVGGTSPGGPIRYRGSVEILRQAL